MMYKGYDLDLRTLQNDGRDLPDEFKIDDDVENGVYKRTFDADPKSLRTIWVDDEVMALCNQAYDLAVTLGAPEVGLEHLAHAMTQIEATAHSLFELNIHVSSLRGETSAIIMEGFSETSRDGKSLPIKSDELEEVQKESARLAYRRRSPVATTDIVDTLFDMSRENPTRKIIHRNRADFDLRSTAGYTEDDDDLHEGRRRVRISAGSNYLGKAARLPNGAPTVTDTIQNTRMDAIERAIRDLTENMARHRSSFGSLGDDFRDGNEAPQRPVSATGYGDENNNELHYLVNRIERNVDAKFVELARTWSVLGDRLDHLEHTVEGVGEGTSQGFELTPETEARLKTLAFADDRFDKIENLLSSLPQRLAEMEHRMEGWAASGGGDSNFEITPVMTSLRDVEAGLRGVGGQLREVDSRTGDVNLIVDAINDRQQRLESLLELQQEQISDLAGMVREEVGQMGNALLGQTDGGDHIKQLVESSLRDVTDSVDRQKEAVASSVTGIVAERFAGFTSQMQNKLARLEELMTQSAERTPVVSGSTEFDSSFLDDAVGKIINNQHTLATSIDELRNQWQSEATALQGRMDKIDSAPVATPALPHERFEEISERLKHIQSKMPERHADDVWTRFKMWLFGTTDWYGESWSGGREDDRTWTPPPRTTEQAGTADPSVCDANSPDRNQQV
jgi:hypothetical protein